MYRISIDKSTGKIIEMQSGGQISDHACLETLRQNAVQAGYQAEEIDVKWVSTEEYLEALDYACTIDEAVNRRCADIDNLRDNKIMAGVPYTFPGAVSGTIQTRSDADFRNITGFSTAALVMMGQPVTLKFRDQEDRVHDLTPQQAVELGLAVTQALSAIYQVAWAHKDTLAALQSRLQIDAYDITTGWPV